MSKFHLDQLETLNVMNSLMIILVEVGISMQLEENMRVVLKKL